MLHFLPLLPLLFFIFTLRRRRRLLWLLYIFYVRILCSVLYISPRRRRRVLLRYSSRRETSTAASAAADVGVSGNWIARHTHNLNCFAVVHHHHDFPYVFAVWPHFFLCLSQTHARTHAVSSSSSYTFDSFQFFHVFLFFFLKINSLLFCIFCFCRDWKGARKSIPD